MPLVLSVRPEGFKEVEMKLMGVSKGAPKAIAEAVNRGLTAGRTYAVKRIRERYNATAAGLKAEGLSIKKASWTSLGGALVAKGSMLPVSIFSPSVKGGRSTKKGYISKSVSVMIIRGNRRVISPTSRGPGVSGAFMIPSGKVMERRQPERYPISQVETIGVPYMFGKMEIFTSTQQKIDEATNQRLEHNVSRLLGTGGGWGG